MQILSHEGIPREDPALSGLWWCQCELLAPAVHLIWAGEACEEQHSALHLSQQHCKLLRPPWPFQTMSTFSIALTAVSTGTAPSLCKELFPQ